MVCFLDDCELQDYVKEAGCWDKKREPLEVLDAIQGEDFTDIAQAGLDACKSSIEVGRTSYWLTVENWNGLRGVRIRAHDARSLANPQNIALSHLLGRSFRTATMQTLSTPRSHQNLSCVRQIRARTLSSTRQTPFMDLESA